MRKLVVTLLCLVFICTNAYAGTPGSRVFILFINGINTSETDAWRNLEQFKKLSFVESNFITWDLLYNETHGLLASDLWDVLRQKKQENKELTIDDYVVTYMKTYNLNYPPNSPEYEKLKKEIKKDYMNDPSFSGMNLSEIVDQFHQIVKDTQNSYVLLLSHSQGTLYANQLYTYLIEEEHFPPKHIALFGIASPSDRILGTVPPVSKNVDKYVTAYNDYVINTLNFFSHFIPNTSPPLPGNVALSTCDDILCHGLIDSYLKDKSTSHIIGWEIASYLLSLKINLIKGGRNGNIRLLTEFIPDGLNRTAELISKNSGQIICEVTPETIGCDKNIMSYLEIPQVYYDLGSDPFRNQFIGFTDKLKAGNYLLLLKFSDENDYMILNLLGNIKSAIKYKTAPFCESLELVDFSFYVGDEPPDGPYTGFQGAMLRGGYSMYDCIHKFPQLIYNNKLLGGDITLI